MSVALVRNQLINHAITTDAQFVGRFIGSLQRPGVQSVGPVASFCLASYFSLFVHESYCRLKTLHPALAASLSNDAKTIIARSRHSLKFFEDTQRGLAGQLAYFRDEIISTHKDRFLGKTWFPPARFLETDLGLYLYKGVPMSSTHVATFALGFEPQALLNKGTSRLVRGTFIEYGRYFALLGATIDDHPSSFANSVDPARLKDKDVRSANHYARTFNGGSTPEINALLGVFQASLNFSDLILPLDVTPASYQTIFKIRFLVLYQIIRSLDILRQERSHQLSTVSLDAIHSIVDSQDAHLLIDGSARSFRNTLMHYGPDSRVDLRMLDLQAPLYGLVQACFPGYDDLTLVALLTERTAHTAQVMNDWASR